jgi:multidrug resistance efflux pump
VRSVGGGVASSQPANPGTLPTVDNNRDWLRQAQRIPVVIDIDAEDKTQLPTVPIGGQADVLVYTGDNLLMNTFGALYIRAMSWLSYLY